MKRLRILLLCFLVSTLASGCWNQTELNRLGIVSAIAYDLDESNQWTITYQVIIPRTSQGASGGGGSEAPVTVFSSTGRTIGEASQKKDFETPRRLFFAHTRVIILGRRAATYGVDQILDTYLRSNETRENAYILVTEGLGQDVLEVLTTMDPVPGILISSLLSGQGGRQSNLAPSKMHEFISSVTNPTASAILSEIKVSGVPENQKSLDALKKTRSSAVLKISRIGVFKENRFAGWLSVKESFGVAWMTNRMKNTIVSFSCKGDGADGQLSSFFVESSRAKLKPSLSDGRLAMSVEIEAKGSLYETPCSLDLKKPETIKELNGYIRQKIKADVEQSYRAVAGMHADMLGFGDAFHRKYPQAWKRLSKNWRQEFAKIKLDVEVRVTIRRTGMINDSFSKISGTKD